MMIKITDDYWLDHSLISALRKDVIEPGFTSVCCFEGGGVSIKLDDGEIERIANEVNDLRAKDSR